MITRTRDAATIGLLALVAAAVLSSFGCGRPSGTVARTGGVPVRLTAIGSPTWEPRDFHLVSRPFDPNTVLSDLLTLVLGTTTTSTADPHTVHPSLGVGPGAPHAGPYDRELADGLRRLGAADSAVFRASEFAAPNAVILACMLVPRGRPGDPVGSSPDFASGPIIPRSAALAAAQPTEAPVFPIMVSLGVFKNGVPFDLGGVAPFVTALDQASPPVLGGGGAAYDGHSHIPCFFIENVNHTTPGAAPFDDPVGTFEFRVTLIDQLGSGWAIAASFKVVN